MIRPARPTARPPGTALRPPHSNASKSASRGSSGSHASDLVKAAEERLQAHKSPKSIAAIKKLTQDHGLTDEVQLALRLLEPANLEELLAGGEDLQRKLGQVPDKSALMRSLVSMLDPAVDELVRGLQELEQHEGAAAAGSDDLVAEALKRMEVSKTAESVEEIERFRQEHDLSDEVQLALRLLAPSHLAELLAGEEDIRQKFTEVPDRNELMRSLVRMLDPSVDELVTGLQALDQGQDEHDDAPDAGSESVIAKAEQRLEANKSSTSTAAIRKLSDDFGLTDEVHLAVRLMAPTQLQEFLAGESDLRSKLAEVPDANELVRSLVLMLDPEVEGLVQGLSQLDGESGGAAEQAGVPGALPRGYVMPAAKARTSPAASASGGGRASALAPTKTKASSAAVVPRSGTTVAPTRSKAPSAAAGSHPATAPFKRSVNSVVAGDTGNWGGDQKRWKGDSDDNWKGWKGAGWNKWQAGGNAAAWSQGGSGQLAKAEEQSWKSGVKSSEPQQVAPKKNNGQAAVEAEASPPSLKSSDSGAQKKAAKCMICKGPHRAADCPKMK